MIFPRNGARAALLTTALFAVFATGCKPQGEPDPAAPAEQASPAPAASTGADEPPATPGPPLPETPALRVATLDHGDYDLADHRDKWVVVNFWATWCAPCLKEMPELSALDAMNEHVEVIGLAYEEIEPDAMREFLGRHPAGYPIAIIDTFAPPADFETPRGLPMTWLIAPDGTVAKRFLGPITSQDLAAAIDAHGAAPAAG